MPGYFHSSSQRGDCRLLPVVESLEPRRLLALSVELLANLETRGIGASPDRFRLDNQGLVRFIAETSSGRQTYQTDGTVAGTQVVTPQLADTLSGRIESFDLDDGQIIISNSTKEDRIFYSPREGQSKRLFASSIVDGAVQQGEEIYVQRAGSIVGDGRTLLRVSKDGVTEVSELTNVRDLAVASGRVIVVADGVWEGVELVASVWSKTAESGVFTPFVEHDSIQAFAANDDDAFFVRQDALHVVRDGVPVEVGSIAPIPARSKIRLVAANGGVYLLGTDQLWFSDGEQITLVAEDVRPQNSLQRVETLDVANFFFLRKADGDDELIRHEPQSNRVELLASFPAKHVQPNSLRSLAGRLHFSAAGVYWTSDGTPAGTESTDVRIDDDMIVSPNGVDVYFSGSPGDDNFELWKSDGTAAGTRLVIDLHPQTEDFDFLKTQRSAKFVQIDERLYFADQHRLFMIAAGHHVPQLVFAAEDEMRITDIGAVSNNLIVLTSNGCKSEAVSVDSASDSRVVWADANTCFGSQTPLIEAGAAVYFQAGVQLIYADGAASGIVGTLPTTAPISSLVALDDGVLFTQVDPQDSSAQIVYHLPSGADVPETVARVSTRGALDLVDLDGNLVVWSRDGIWETRTDLSLGENAFAQTGFSIIEAVKANGLLYFYAQDSSTRVGHLLRSDGTLEGTFTVDESVGASNLHPYGDGIAYLADREVKSTDGTQIGTKSIYEFRWNRKSIRTGGIAESNGRLYFLHDGDAATSPGLWSTDGSEAGTRFEVQFSAAKPWLNLAAFDDALFLPAKHPTHGEELHRIDLRGANRPGDLNRDGRVNYDDFLILSANFGQDDASREQGDLNGDQVVGFEDFLILSRSYGQD